ncbi:senescence-related gene 1 [Actinidia rufa]|uniref:Senescence-related gene 1 n=1 Tax=Actinidia rufa TaxID=165716 RepID=A0A7J0ERX8_9ERIC|nr:senescence-related gene 1 [Actinidia rufa]
MEAAKFTSLGRSLQVPCVQELAKSTQATVPPRYVRADQDPIKFDTFSLPEIPVIDLQRLLSGDSMDSELEKFHSVCKNWGFFQLINHGVSSTLVEKVKLEIEELFKLPMEEKKKYWQEAGDIHGFGQLFVVSEEQKLDWADLFYLVTLPTHMRKANLFSKLPLSFRLRKLASCFERGMQAMRMNYYPPCPQPELVIGLTPHSDAGGLTILLQLNEVEGLQIKKDGMWVPVRPLPNAFTVNIGDILEIVTNGIYKSIEHRVVVNSEKERFSIATFHSSNLDGDVGPAPSLITPETPALFKSVGVADYYRRFLGRKLHEKSNLDVMRIQNEETENNLRSNSGSIIYV